MGAARVRGQAAARAGAEVSSPSVRAGRYAASGCREMPHPAAAFICKVEVYIPYLWVIPACVRVVLGWLKKS